MRFLIINHNYHVNSISNIAKGIPYLIREEGEVWEVILNSRILKDASQAAA
jgi:hypothetical protein